MKIKVKLKAYREITVDVEENPKMTIKELCDKVEENIPDGWERTDWEIVSKDHVKKN